MSVLGIFSPRWRIVVLAQDEHLVSTPHIGLSRGEHGVCECGLVAVRPGCIHCPPGVLEGLQRMRRAPDDEGTIDHARGASSDVRLETRILPKAFALLKGFSEIRRSAMPMLVVPLESHKFCHRVAGPLRMRISHEAGIAAEKCIL